MNLRNGYQMIRAAASDFLDDNAMTLAASLAFYSALSLAPLLVILISAASLLGSDRQSRIVAEIETAVGPQAGEAVHEIIQSGEKQQQTGTLATVAGFAVLLFSATGVFAQMQDSLNAIWEVQAKPGQGLWRWLRKRILSLGMLLGIGFLLMISLGLTTVINVIFAGTSGWIWQAVNFVASLLIYIALFALIYKVLPDVKITWADVWAGATMTAVLFVIGKFLLGLYLGRSSVASAYGAAGSLIVLLLWVYYAAIIFFFGAELTQVYARFCGRGLEPEEHAESVPGAKRKEEPAEVGAR